MLNEVLDNTGDSTTVTMRPSSEASSTMRLTSRMVNASTCLSALLLACEMDGTAEMLSPIRANCWMVFAAEVKIEAIPIPVECRI